MAVMTDQQRAALWAEFMSDLSQDREALSITKADIRAALNALDQFISDNAAAINSSIPQPARSALTVPQKARLLSYVIRKRYIEGT